MKMFNQGAFSKILTSDTFLGLEWSQYDSNLEFAENKPFDSGSYLCLTFNKVIGNMSFDVVHFNEFDNCWDRNESNYIVLCWSNLPKIYTTMVSRDIAEIYKYYTDLFIKNEEILTQESKKNRILELEQELTQLKNN